MITDLGEFQSETTDKCENIQVNLSTRSPGIHTIDDFFLK